MIPAADCSDNFFIYLFVCFASFKTAVYNLPKRKFVCFLNQFAPFFVIFIWSELKEFRIYFCRQTDNFSGFFCVSIPASDEISVSLFYSGNRFFGNPKIIFRIQ